MEANEMEPWTGDDERGQTLYELWGDITIGVT